MMWLIWNMWILLLLAFIGGVVTGWILHGKSDETPKSGPRGLLEPAQGPHSHATSATLDAEPVKAKIKGLGPKAAAKLSENGVTSLAQIANWTADDVARMDDMINGRGRIERDDWVGQAKALSA